MSLFFTSQVRKRMAKRGLKGARQCSGHAYRTNTAAVVVTLCGLAIFFLCLYFGHFLSDTSVPYEGLSSYLNSYDDLKSYRPPKFWPQPQFWPPGESRKMPQGERIGSERGSQYTLIILHLIDRDVNATGL